MNRVLFPHIYWWVLLVIPFTFFGFYPTYFSTLFSSMPSVIHAHAIFMMVWLILVIVQPLLIKQKKMVLHKQIGKISYVIMPIVFVTAFLMIQHSYSAFIVKETDNVMSGISNLSADEIKVNAAANAMIGLVYFFWLIVFYSLAIINRKKMVVHATYMFAAFLTLLGPTVDRILYSVYQYAGWGFNLFAEIAVFTFIDLLLIALLLYQRKNGNSGKVVFFALTIYLTGQLGYFLLPKTAGWRLFVELIL